MIKVTCIDDSFKPNEIPTSKWVVKGKEYTIVKIEFMLQQSRQLGCELEEINLNDCFPHTRFKLSRFAPVTETDVEQVNKRVKELVN